MKRNRIAQRSILVSLLFNLQSRVPHVSMFTRGCFDFCLAPQTPIASCFFGLLKFLRPFPSGVKNRENPYLVLFHPVSDEERRA